jgi:catechol 2,3-dioxygenase-like lactoylglutathione lyase family enzyme
VAERRAAVQDRGVTPDIRLTAPVLGTPDPQGLARFYQRLLGWPIRDDDPQWATLRPVDGSTGLSFQLEADHVPPVWPPEPGSQQMQMHLDLQVDDLDAASAIAVEAGAEQIGGHEDDDEIVRVYRDPAGHPFCLFVVKTPR